MREGLIPKPRKNLVGTKYGHWLVIGQDLEESQLKRKVIWKCECDCGCGTQKSIRADALKQTIIGGCENCSLQKERICEKCGNKFFPLKRATTRKFCYDCVPDKIEPSGSTRRRIAKKWGIEYKGNKCICCGYDKCIEALDFHHLDQNEKEFNISEYGDKNLNWLELKKELDKCILVCANCHREIHAGIRTIDEKEVN